MNKHWLMGPHAGSDDVAHQQLNSEARVGGPGSCRSGRVAKDSVWEGALRPPCQARPGLWGCRRWGAETRPGNTRTRGRKGRGTGRKGRGCDRKGRGHGQEGAGTWGRKGRLRHRPQTWIANRRLFSANAGSEASMAGPVRPSGHSLMVIPPMSPFAACRSEGPQPHAAVPVFERVRFRGV